MKFDELFENRILIASKLKMILRERGYSKVSFCKKTGISRPTLDRILSADIDNKTSFDKHLQKILNELHLSVEDFFYFSERPKQVEAVFSSNPPANYEMNKKAKKQYELLQDVLDLCFVYY